MARVARAVGERLEAFFDEVSQRPVSTLFDTRLSALLLDQVRGLTLRAGKRLRSALLVHGAALFDAEALGREQVLDAAGALELLQTYFLIHDDIMDGDELRRGGPSAHVALARQTGDARLGESLGILAGDMASALASVLLLQMRTSAEQARLVAEIFAAMHLDVVNGQTLDLLGKAPAEQVAAHKTASYTTVGPVAVGAVLGGADQEEVARLGALALPLGVAFQYRDDLLDAFGDSRTTGKPTGSDIRSGKQTFLAAEARRLATGADRRALDAALGRATATAEELDGARRAMEACGAKAACERRIAELVDVFVQGLEAGTYLAEGRRFLSALALYIAVREG